MTANCRDRIDRFVDLDAPVAEGSDLGICPTALRALLATLARQPELDAPLLVCAGVCPEADSSTAAGADTRRW